MSQKVKASYHLHKAGNSSHRFNSNFRLDCPQLDVSGTAERSMNIIVDVVREAKGSKYSSDIVLYARIYY